MRYECKCPNPKFRRRRTRVKVFIFKKCQGAQILIFCMKHEASFYIKEKRRIFFLICVLKLLFCTPEKAYFGEILLNFIDTNQFLFSFILLSYLRVPSVCKYTFKVKNEQFKKNSQIFLCNFVQYRYFFSFQVELAQKLHLNMY